MHIAPTPTDTVLVVTDGTVRSTAIIDQLLHNGRSVAVTGRCTRDLVAYVDARVHDHVWAVVSDPSDPDQIATVIERATESMGPVIMVIDPGGLLDDVHDADRRVA
ncbi:hypothetical protein GYA93_20295 [Gordonia desulfuricans]|uniref:SDR family NAD(P)-dependent oxidoreductase n=1 Tax=Gordonia desulfuricans TaxID=89051 RepID=A0A7K3LUD7_9ACTN|nr:hypothetical protein [Gordonia desulfuricans]NDK91890.1 hypothetical protein [Gordonia desulfuricans]